ncbi:hypothetical protein I0Q91_07825 [Halanaerobiaceae bacterium Z-7014]|uniref:Uncharacterized protein n=1 Tax=Halonatronomonas betaini TaxID=2778430 RepID=A0A931AUE4_9FIRM|nr:hypothetical protein [Halonatronomonas betaini]MBF8436980.1 hypothetical protein [Halonatronomonas betaini]
MKRYKIPVLMLIVLSVFLLAGCDNPFTSDPTDILSEFSIPERVEPQYDRSYFTAIRDQNPRMLRNTLHPDEEIIIVTNGDFYGRDLSIEEYRTVEDYVGSYVDVYFQEFAINRVNLRERSVSNNNDDSFIYTAEVEKTFHEVPHDDEIDSSYVLEYDLEIELVKEDSVYYIVRIEKTN